MITAIIIAWVSFKTYKNGKNERRHVLTVSFSPHRYHDESDMVVGGLKLVTSFCFTTAYSCTTINKSV